MAIGLSVMVIDLTFIPDQDRVDGLDG
jgi:hypothetical protein